MFRPLTVALLSFALADPLFCKDGKISDTFALGIDMATGSCQVQELDPESERPLGFKLLGKYDSSGTNLEED